MSLTLKTKSANTTKGFTLLEILLVVAIISILAGIVILAINPTKQLGDTRNAQRRSDVLTILNAIYQYSLDNSGDLPDDVANADDTCMDSTDNENEICQGDECDDTDLLDIYTDLVGDDADYLVSIPRAPEAESATTTGSGYGVAKLDNGRLTVCALAPDNNVDISVTR
jgi:prepilin-type N-terminal cleavage/methylation domain-containing protein